MRHRRLLFALSASLALHLILLGLGLPQEKVGLRGTAISARILPPAQVRPAEPLLKDTLAEEAAGPSAAPPPTAGTKGRRPAYDKEREKEDSNYKKPNS